MCLPMCFKGGSFVCTPTFSERKLSLVGVWSKVNLLAPELFFLILAHSVYKIRIIHEPNTLEL